MKKFTVVLAMLVSTAALAQINRVAEFDTDRDGRVSYTELTARCEVSPKLFSTADKNSDGYLSEYELRDARFYLFGRCNKS